MSNGGVHKKTVHEFVEDGNFDLVKVYKLKIFFKILKSVNLLSIL